MAAKGWRIDCQGALPESARPALLGQRDEDLLLRLLGDPGEAGDTPDRQQDDVRGVDAVMLRREDVAELVEQNAAEEREHREHAADCGRRSSVRPTAQRDPRKQHQEGDVHLHVGARDPADAE